MYSAFHEILVPTGNIPAIILLHDSATAPPCPLHWHSAVELCYSVNSKLDVTIDDNSFILHENSVAIVNSGCTHQINPVTYYENDCLSVIICYPFLQTMYPEIDTINFKLNNNDSAFNDLILTLDKLYKLYKSDDNSFRYLQANEFIYKILYLLFTNFTEKKLSKSSVSSQKYHQRYDEILKFIEDNYAEPLTLDDISKFSNISKHHLSREFKKYVGDGFKKHVSKLRIQHSLSDLTTTDMVLIDIAVKHGFNDSRSYINAFKELFGITPSKYRKDFMFNKNI